MYLSLVGINHNTAPINIREKIAFTESGLKSGLKNLFQAEELEELAILSTCNRTEIFSVSRNSATSDIKKWLASYQNIDYQQISNAFYTKDEKEAVMHSMRVASGLDSLIMGESQILGQFKDCFDNAKIVGTLGPELTHLSQTVFRTAKLIRAETKIGEKSVSLGSLTVTLANQLFSKLSKCKILLVGAGEISELIGKHLKSAGIKQIVIANRTVKKGAALANNLNGLSISLDKIVTELPSTDIVICSTSSPLPIIGKGAVERALRNKKHRPILMIDLGLPRNIEPEVGSLRDIYLYGLDDYKEIINQNISIKEKAAANAEEIIKYQAGNYISREETKRTSQLLIEFRNLHNSIKDIETQKAISRLGKGDDPKEVVINLANQLTNKMIHEPSLNLKAASTKKEWDIVEAAVQLYGLKNKDE